ncbi:MAG: sulfatase-like hydrolase/transferase, partial [Ilumatobacter sp.]
MTGPNILLIMADQLSAPFLRTYGGPAITPNTHRLAAVPTTFSSPSSNRPLCAPARFAMTT